MISSTDEIATAVECLVWGLSRCLKVYRIPLEDCESSALPNAASVRHKCQNIFKDIITDLGRVEQSLSNSEETMDDAPLIFDTFKTISGQRSFCDLSSESLKFLLFQAMMEILIRRTYTEDDIKHMWNLCYQDCKHDCKQAKKVRTFQAAYGPEKAINYYTQNSFLYRLINRAFRLEDTDRIFQFGCYLADLHEQLKNLANEQRNTGRQYSKTFYRGKRFSADVIQKFKDNEHHLITMNGLFSTTKDFNVSTAFAGIEGHHNGYHRVIFEINVNEAAANLIRPYANVRDVAAIQDENEVLFFMGSVWKIQSVTEYDNNVWYIVLDSCADYDAELITYIEETRRDCSYLILGNILRELGDYVNAKNSYMRMLEDVKDRKLPNEIRGLVHFEMGELADYQGIYMEALEHYGKALQFIGTMGRHCVSVPSSPRPLFAHRTGASELHILNNKGRAYLRDG
ncbi:unnamed protein product, partial [Rotaria sp. Silwood2]